MDLGSLLRDRSKLAVVAIVMAFIGVGMLVTSSRANTLIADGQQATATVVDKLSYRGHTPRTYLKNKRSRDHRLRVQIDGVPGTHDANVCHRLWNGTSEGQTVTVVYSQSNPDNVRVGTLEEVTRTAGTLRASVPFAFLLIAGAIAAGVMSFMAPAGDS